MTQAPALSTEMKVTSASASLLSILSVRLWTRAAKLFPSSRFVINQEDSPCFGRVFILQREQAVWLPPIMWHSADTTPPSTHAVFRYVFLLAMVGTYPPYKIFHWEQLAVLTDICERDGSSSLFLTHHAPQKNLCCATMVLCVNAFLAWTSANHPYRFHRPSRHILHIRHASEAVPSNITDPRCIRLFHRI